MESWQPTQSQSQSWEEKGYFTVPGGRDCRPSGRDARGNQERPVHARA